MWFAILFFTWQPALSLESEEKKKKKTFSGNLNILSLVEYPFLDLETGLAMTFSFNPYAVFICNGFSIALLEQGDCFYLFESHARASDGMPNVNGKNIFVKENKYNWHFPYICVDCLVLIIPLLQQRWVSLICIRSVYLMFAGRP